jgi:autotransporter family porin
LPATARGAISTEGANIHCSGGFKTLTVGSYAGTGPNITLSTALGSPNAGSTDQVIINGGSATGLTSLTIKNASGAAGAATTGAGIPVVIVTNGGTTSPTAFHLANDAPILAGGFEYNFDRASNQDWYLVSSSFATVGQIQGQNQNSVRRA